MSDLSAFRQTGATVSVSASGTTGNVAITGHQGTVMVHNKASLWAYVTSGIGNGTTATSAGYWCAPGTTQPLAIPTNHTYMAAMLETTGTGTVGFTPGCGV
jgi:hypothetical protein